MSPTVIADPAFVACVRSAGGDAEEDLDWSSVPADMLAEARPWRTFRWYLGQKHYSGTYWSSTMGDHVIYESRLELSRLLFADFDPGVRKFVAQPFLLKARIDGGVRRHIPDYLLVRDRGPVVVDVKPARRLEDERVAFTFAWTRQAVEERGWEYEVFSEPDPAELANVRFLAGYRRPWLFDSALLEELRTAVVVGMTLGEAFLALPERPRPMVKAAVLHLLWNGDLVTDLARPLGVGHLLGRSA